MVMTDQMKPCPQCESPYGYYMDETTYACPECRNEWEPTTNKEKGLEVFDVNGNMLINGDTVVVIKDLPVKGAPKPIKVGTKVKKIRLKDGDHNIACKIDGFGSMSLQSEFVRKA